MKIKIIFYALLLCNYSPAHSMESTIAPLSEITDKNLQKIIQYINTDSFNIVTTVKAYAQNQKINLNSSTLAPLLNLNQKQIDTLFLEYLENDELRPLLLDMRANINTLTEEKHNCLWYTKNPTLLKTLIDKGATVDQISKSGFSRLTNLLYCLEYSKDEKDIKVAQVFLEHGKANPNIPLPYNTSLFQHVIVCPNPTMRLAATELLCTYNANANHQDTQGNSPLIIAIKQGALDIVELLLKSNAKPNLPNNSQEYPLHVAMEEDHNYTYISIRPIMPEIVRLLLEYNANPNQLYPSYTNNSPLHVAVVRKQIVVIKNLIEHGAQKDLPNKQGHTPFDLAQRSNKSEAVLFSTEILELLKPDSSDNIIPTINNPITTINKDYSLNTQHTHTRQQPQGRGCLLQ